jgi:hypothetical protein
LNKSKSNRDNDEYQSMERRKNINSITFEAVLRFPAQVVSLPDAVDQAVEDVT